VQFHSLEGRLSRPSDKQCSPQRKSKCPRFFFTRQLPSRPEQYIAGLTDFGPDRSKLFGDSAGEYLKVHQRDRLLGLVLRTIGKGVLERAFVNSVKAIEARNGVARE
jgi:hypothetical protein